MANEGFASLQILDSLDEVVKPEERTRKYVCEYYSVMAHPRGCFFCKHSTDVFYDFTNGPYMIICDLQSEHDQDLPTYGFYGECKHFDPDK